MVQTTDSSVGTYVGEVCSKHCVFPHHCNIKAKTERTNEHVLSKSTIKRHAIGNSLWN